MLKKNCRVVWSPDASEQFVGPFTQNRMGLRRNEGPRRVLNYWQVCSLSIGILGPHMPVFSPSSFLPLPKYEHITPSSQMATASVKLEKNYDTRWFIMTRGNVFTFL